MTTFRQNAEATALRITQKHVLRKSASILILLASNSQFLHSGLKRSSLHPQLGGRPPHPGNDSSGLAQHTQDVLAFHVLQSETRAG